MVIWITGLSGSGKTTIAKRVFEIINKKYKNSVFLDGDIIREVLKHSGYSLEDRLKSAWQTHNLCKLLDKQGLVVVIATMSLFDEIQKANRNKFSSYYEIFLDVDMDILIKRDQKQLYSRALKGLEKNVVGIDLPYDKPKNADLYLKNETIDELNKNIKAILGLINVENYLE